MQKESGKGWFTRRVLSFALWSYHRNHRKLGPVQSACGHTVGVTVKPLTGESDQTAPDLAQPVNRTYTDAHLNSNPVPYEAYLVAGTHCENGFHGHCVDIAREDTRSTPSSRVPSLLRYHYYYKVVSLLVPLVPIVPLEPLHP